jgi:transcriptional regulator
MYAPSHFRQQDPAELRALIEASPLAVLVTFGAGRMHVSHIPLLFDAAVGPHGTLIGHFAAANPQAQHYDAAIEAIAIFNGPDAYVSPNWYPSKHELHKQVPTWNYRVVHVHGRLRIRDDEKFVRGVVARLTRVHEAGTGDARPWKMTDSAPAYIDQLLAMIVGIEIEITKMVGKWKLSQNKDARDRANAADELRKRGEQEISAAMQATVTGKQG